MAQAISIIYLAGIVGWIGALIYLSYNTNDLPGEPGEWMIVVLAAIFWPPVLALTTLWFALVRGPLALGEWLNERSLTRRSLK